MYNNVRLCTIMHDVGRGGAVEFCGWIGRIVVEVVVFVAKIDNQQITLLLPL